MRVAFAVTAVVALLVGSGSAWAEVSEQQDRFMQNMKETVYATNHHMGFSMRSSIIRWLGGVTIVDEADLRASEQDKWWGSDVPLISADAIKGDVQ